MDHFEFRPQRYWRRGNCSDVGGGYSPGDQGKATTGRTALLSQIALNDMYHEALNAAVKLVVKADLEAVTKADFAIHPDLDKAFSDYARWTTAYDEKQNVAAVGGAPEYRMHYHTQLYWRWRAAVSPDAKFKALASYQASNPQDQVDLRKPSKTGAVTCKPRARLRSPCETTYRPRPARYPAPREATPVSCRRTC